MKKTKKKIYAGSLILKILVILAAVFTLVMLGYLIVYILAKGIPHLTPSLFSIHYDSDNVSMLPSIYQYIDHDWSSVTDRSSGRCIFSGISDRVCKKRK